MQGLVLEVSGVRLPLDAGLPGAEGLVRSALAQALGVRAGDVGEFRLLRRSVDARKSGVRFVATYAVDVGDAEVAPAKGVHVKEHVPYVPLAIPRLESPGEDARPVVVGTGPAGLFAALYLARAGLRPLVLERGGDVDERTRAVDAFNRGELLDLATNVQFGEGGAGTFSDGKLTTGTKSPLARHVLQWFVDAGAPDEILWQAKPHVGTDKLVEVVRNLRREIERAGGEVRFHAKLDDIVLDEGGHLREIVVKGRDADVPDERIPCDALVLACGHSARDTFRMLQRAHVRMEPKPFSVGVRIEHRQADIDRVQYGASAGHPALGAADYKLVAHLPGGRSVYTFCMCPGGEVVAAASEEFGVVVNGMSRFARDGENSNAALLVNVGPDDFPSADPLAGTVFQRRIEQAAYGEAVETGGEPWQAPAQTVGDLLAERAGNPSATVKPSYARGVVWCDLREILPDFVTEAIVEAMPLLDRKLHGFANPDAVMTGVETRSSSPVRIARDAETLQASVRIEKRKVRARDAARGHGTRPGDVVEHRDIGVYPAGEGPGYAGGIMSAAVDGLRVAVRIAQVQVLKQGRAVIFPTDTVYGLGVAVRHAETPQELFDLKRRDAGKPVAWLIADAPDLDRYGADVASEARELAERGWPGALTLIVKASDEVPAAYRSAQGTIGLRVPAGDALRALIREVGPIAATSANRSGAPAPATLAEIDPALLAEVAAAIEGAGALSGEPSTVIDCTQGAPRIIRGG